MMRNLDTDPQARAYRPGSQSPTSDASSEVAVNFSTVFKQLFCVAASQLSHNVHEPLENLGELFEEALDTGTTHLMKTSRTHRKPSTATFAGEKGVTDLEADAFGIGRGKYLFLNRQLTKGAADRYAAMGFRFASIGQVADLLSRNMEVKPEKMHSRLERMKASVATDCLPPPGVHLAFFMVRPSVHKSFDVLVPAMLQNQLPTQPLKLFLLTDWHRSFIRRYDEWTIRDILSALVKSGDTVGERDFAITLHGAILGLIDQVSEMNETILSSVFSARPVELSLPKSEDGMSDKCTLLTIRIMNDIHAKPRTGMAYVPLSFFGAQQVVQAGGSKERDRWERRVRMEFGYGLGGRKESVGSELHSSLSSPWGFWANGDGSHGRASVSSLKLWPSWLGARGRGGSGAGHDRGESVDGDEARIVKTVEISLKEEKEEDEGDHSTNESSGEVNRVASHGIESLGVGRGGEGDDTEKRAEGLVGAGGLPTGIARRGAYTAGCQGGGGVSFADAGRGARGSVYGGVEMVELEAAEKGDGGWVSEVFGMFRL